MNDKITPENYEGYCALLDSKMLTDEQYDKYLVKMFKSGVIPGVLFFLAVIFHVSDILILLSILNFIIVPPAVTIKTIVDDNNTIKEEITKKYPNINVNLSLRQLNVMFKESGIKNTEAFFLEYKNYVKCEEIKQEMLNEMMKKPIEVEYDIPSSELEKVKVKIKTMKK